MAARVRDYYEVLEGDPDPAQGAARNAERDPAPAPRIRRLRRDLGLSLGAVAIIVRLLDRMEALERATAARPRP
jgi:hypothetical protein